MKDLSCRMIHDFNANETFILEYFENEQLAYEATKQGNIWGYVGFHENFTNKSRVGPRIFKICLSKVAQFINAPSISFDK